MEKGFFTLGNVLPLGAFSSGIDHISILEVSRWFCQFLVRFRHKPFIRKLKQGRRRRQRERQKKNFARASRFFCTFLCRRCTTTTWKCLISRFIEDRNTKQQFQSLSTTTVLFRTTFTRTIKLDLLLNFFFSPELWYNPFEFNSKEVCQHLTN